MEKLLHHAAYALAWASFGAVHSLLAADWVKARADAAFRPYYRLSYNVWAGLHLAGILALEALAFPGRTLLGWPDWATWILYGLQAAGWLTVLVALSRYDLSRFAGIEEAAAALKAREAGRGGGAPRGDARAGRDAGAPATEETPEPLQTGGLHAYVRHPLYTGIFIVLWTRISNDFQVATAVWGSLYLVIGTHFEERRLGRVYGDAYRRYARAVPAFIPWRGKAWPARD